MHLSSDFAGGFQKIDDLRSFSAHEGDDASRSSAEADAGMKIDGQVGLGARFVYAVPHHETKILELCG